MAARSLTFTINPPEPIAIEEHNATCYVTCNIENI
jgi:hypothetical protein